jgi:hypothetical protein
VRGALGDKETKVMTRQRSRFGRQRAGWAFLAFVAVLALVAGACGNDDDDTTAGVTAGGSTETDTGSTGDDTAAFCQARIDLERAFGSEQPDVDAVMALLKDMEASAPDAVAANAAGLADVLATAAESGTDPSEDPRRWHTVGNTVPPEIELCIREMRQTLLVGEDPHILHRRIVPDWPPHAPSDLLSWCGSRWTPP